MAFASGTAGGFDPRRGLVPLFCPEHGIQPLPLTYEPMKDTNNVVMKRLRKNPSSGTPVTASSLEEFQTNFNREHPNMLHRLEDVLLQEPVIIAGGAVLHALTSSSGIRTAGCWGGKSDIDLFITAPVGQRPIALHNASFSSLPWISNDGPSCGPVASSQGTIGRNDLAKWMRKFKLFNDCTSRPQKYCLALIVIVAAAHTMEEQCGLRRYASLHFARVSTCSTPYTHGQTNLPVKRDLGNMPIVDLLPLFLGLRGSALTMTGFIRLSSGNSKAWLPFSKFLLRWKHDQVDRNDFRRSRILSRRSAVE